MEFPWFSQDFRVRNAHITGVRADDSVARSAAMTASLTRNRWRLIGITIPTAAIWWLTASAVFAQSFGASVGGVVSDETGAVLPGVTVTVTHVSNGRTVAMTTEEHGDYRAVALQPGDYQFVVERSGFMPASRLVTLLVGANPVLDFTLRIA